MKSKTLKYPNSTRFQYAARLFHEKPLWERKQLLKRVQPKTLEEAQVLRSQYPTEAPGHEK